jgi:hypothetical protein
MTEINKKTLPKRHYYTLQQAADALNNYLKTIHSNNQHHLIDVDYLLHLGATGGISMYAQSDMDLIPKRPLGDKIPARMLDYANELLANKDYRCKFLSIMSRDLQEVEFKDESIISWCIDPLVRNMWIHHYPVDEEAEDLRIIKIQQDKGNRVAELKEQHGEFTSEFNKAFAELEEEFLSIKRQPILKNLNDPFISLLDVFWAAAKAYGEEVTPWEFYINQPSENPEVKIGQKVTRESLYIFSNHLEAFKQQIIPVACPNPSDDEQSKYSTNNVILRNERVEKSKRFAAELALALWALDENKDCTKIKMAEKIKDELQQRDMHLPETLDAIGDWIKHLAPVELRKGGRPKKIEK